MKLSGSSWQARRRDFGDFLELGGPVQRTPQLLERAFPKVIWGYPSRDTTSPVHLTFDDGPSSSGTPEILEVLARHGVTATFFLTGSKLIEHPGLTDRLLECGHRIGYHGLTHDSWWLRFRDCRELEMDPSGIPRLDRNPFVEAASPLLLRAPFGRLDYSAVGSAERLGALMVHWRLTVRDWQSAVPVDTLARMLYRFTWPGDIVLLHDSGPGVKTVARALDRVIPAWKAAGMQLTSIDPFLKAHGR